MNVCKQHHARVATGEEKCHVMDIVTRIPELHKFSAIPGCVLQKPEGNPGRSHHNPGCVNMKRRFVEFGMGPVQPFSTSDQDEIAVVLGDSGGCLNKDLDNCMDPHQDGYPVTVWSEQHTQQVRARQQRPKATGVDDSTN